MTFVPQRLLCLVDLSQVSTAVLSWARLLAESYRTEVDVFHALWAPKTHPIGEAVETNVGFEALRREIEGRLNTLADAAFGVNVRYEICVVEGHPVKMILLHIEQHPPDIIILGSHGYDGFARMLLGSVAENILRVAPSPSLFVKGAPLTSDVHGLRTILCAADFDDFSRRCVLAVGDLAAMLDADLHIAYVAAPGAPLAQVRSALSSWIPDQVWASATVHDVVLQGEPAEMILGYARSVQADLVVIAAEHHRFLEEFTTLGRTTERVVRFCHCSVLVIPRITGKSEFVILETARA